MVLNPRLSPWEIRLVSPIFWHLLFLIVTYIKVPWLPQQYLKLLFLIAHVYKTTISEIGFRVHAKQIGVTTHNWLFCKTNIWFSHSWINFSNDAQFVAVLILLLSLAWFSLPLCNNSVSHLDSPQLNLFFLQNQVSLLVHLHTEDQRPGLGRHDPFSHFAELPTQPSSIDVSSLVVNPAPLLSQTCHHLLREADQDLVGVNVTLLAFSKVSFRRWCCCFNPPDLCRIHKISHWSWGICRGKKTMMLPCVIRFLLNSNFRKVKFKNILTTRLLQLIVLLMSICFWIKKKLNAR